MNSAEQFNAMVDRLLKKSRNFYDHVLSPSQWTQTHRVLTSDLGAARPGRWSHDETPYLKEIMDNFAPDSGVVSQTIMKATRMGFTTAAVNVAGWVMDQFPTSHRNEVLDCWVMARAGLWFIATQFFDDKPINWLQLFA